MAIQKIIELNSIKMIIALACCQIIKSSFTLSPRGVAFTCPGGDLIFECRTNRSFLEWNITAFNSDGGLNMTRRRLISSIGHVVRPHALFGTDTLYNFTVSRISSSPLISTLLATDITSDLNGTMIYCTEEAVATLATTIHVISDTTDVKPLETDAMILDWGDNFATVSLNWTQEDINGIHYYVTIDPPADMQFIGNTSIQLTVDYNKLYNISITATICNQKYSSGVTTLFYARCNSSLHSMDNFVRTYFNIPAMEGTTANFSCPPNFVLTGPTTAICTGNGEWEPDPREVKCKADCGRPSIADNTVNIMYNSTLEGASLLILCENYPDEVFTAQCHRNNASWSPKINGEICPDQGSNHRSIVLSLSTLMIVVSSIIFLMIILFTIGFICGNFCQKLHKQPHDRILTNQAMPEQNEECHVDLEMRQNVAYEHTSVPRF